MRKFYLLSIALMIISCGKEELPVQKAATERVADSSAILLEKAKETEAFLQKQADSIVRQFDSLGVPK